MAIKPFTPVTPSQILLSQSAAEKIFAGVDPIDYDQWNQVCKLFHDVHNKCCEQPVLPCYKALLAKKMDN
jgi:hypothetical protein